MGGLQPGPVQVEWDGSVDAHHAEAAADVGVTLSPDESVPTPEGI